jgi:hypothetical protein
MAQADGRESHMMRPAYKLDFSKPARRGARHAGQFHMTIRVRVYVSDGTGITAETIGHSLLTQFTGSFATDRLPFVDTPEKAGRRPRRSAAAASSTATRPIVVNSCVDEDAQPRSWPKAGR